VQDARDVVGGDRNGIDGRGIILSAFLEKHAGPVFSVFRDVVLHRGLQSSPFRVNGGLREDAPAYYLIRLVAYGLILIAILDKNRLGRKSK
jgi:hypothetical protein